MKNYILLFVLLIYSNWSISQCSVTISTLTTNVECGDCFILSADGVAEDTLLSENFDNNQLGAGWAANQVPMFTNPCGPPPNNSPTCWFGDQQTQPRYVETIDYDVTCGGNLCWLMKYAVQGSAGPQNSCEGPDQPNEGVKLQYSLNGGLTWVLIADHPPLNGGTNFFQTNWNTYCQPIPAAAQTLSTRFRWYQAQGSNAGFDHWGIDDVIVTAIDCDSYYYDWTVDGNVNTSDTTLCLTESTEDYSVIYTNGIDDTCSATITMNGELFPDFTFFAPCEGEEVTLTNTSLGIFNNSKWIFQNGMDTIVSQNAIYTFPPGSSLDVELFIEDLNGSCTGTITNTIVETPKLEIVVNNQVDVTCYTGEDGIATVGVTEGTAPYTYVWTNSLSTASTADDLAFGTTTVTVTDTHGCVITETVNIDQPDPLSISNISPDTIICIDDPVDLFVLGSGGSSPYIFSWIENGQVVAMGTNVNVTPTSASTIYGVVLSEQCISPTDTAYVTVNYPGELDPTLLPDITGGCYPVEINFTNSTNTSEVIDNTIWTYSDGDIDTVIGVNNISHEFSLGVWGVDMEIVSERGCRYYKSYTDLIEGYSYPEADFYVNPNPVSIFESTVIAYAEKGNDINSYEWFAEGANPDYSSIQNPKFEYPKVIKNYPLVLVVQNSYGCNDTVKKLVRVENVVTIFAPNTFTPDGDGLNDTWKPSLLGVDTQNYQLQIFNRWGETVFESLDSDGVWDGTYGGKLVKEGSYLWIIRAFDFENDNKHEFNGAVNILR